MDRRGRDAMIMDSPMSDVAEVMGIAPSTTDRIGFRFLSETGPPPSFDGLEAILVDENAVRCGELFVTFWPHRDREAMTTALNQWIGLATTSTVEPVMRFAKNPTKATREITAYAIHRIANGPMEGFNHLVSRRIHRANGIRSLAYLFLRLRAETTPRPVCGAG